MSVQTVWITVDGLDATEKLAKMLRAWKFGAVMLAGVSFAGLNIIDPRIIHEEFGKPIIIMSRTKPDNKAVKRALRRNFEDWRVRWDVFKNSDPVYKVVSAGHPPVYVETVGVGVEWASEFIRALSICSRIPEPIRVARLIARGLS